MYTRHAPVLALPGAILLALLLASPPPAHAVCGDGVIDVGEQCDGTNIGTTTCADLTSGFAQGGTLTCKPDCTFDTMDCRRAFIATLAPATGGPRKYHCQLEAATVGTAVQRGKRVCADGDPNCDQDGQFNSSCTFRLVICFNVPDPRVGSCTAGKTVRLDVLQPGLGDDVSRQATSAILAAVQSAAPDQAHISGSGAAFGPPMTTFTCGSSTLKVPLRGTAGQARPGILRIKARSSDNSGKMRAVGELKLACMP